MCVWHHSVGPPRSHRNQRQFRSSQPSGAATPHSDLRMTPLRWTTLGPTNVAAVSQFAAPIDSEAFFWPLGLTGAHERGDSFAVRSP